MPTGGGSWNPSIAGHTHHAHTSCTHLQLTCMILDRVWRKPTQRTHKQRIRDFGTPGCIIRNPPFQPIITKASQTHITQKQTTATRRAKNVSHVSGKAQTSVQRNGNFIRQGLFCCEIRRHAEEKLPLAGHSRIQIC